ncbi:MAG: hypothetical protein ACRDPY_06145 [Streptosporangiaceae bacterium]
MYGKANPGAGQLTARQKRVFATAGLLVILLVILLLGGLGVWGRWRMTDTRDRAVGA